MESNYGDEKSEGLCYTCVLSTINLWKTQWVLALKAISRCTNLVQSSIFALTWRSKCQLRYRIRRRVPYTSASICFRLRSRSTVYSIDHLRNWRWVFRRIHVRYGWYHWMCTYGILEMYKNRYQVLQSYLWKRAHAVTTFMSTDLASSGRQRQTKTKIFLGEWSGVLFCEEALVS